MVSVRGVCALGSASLLWNTYNSFIGERERERSMGREVMEVMVDYLTCTSGIDISKRSRSSGCNATHADTSRHTSLHHSS